MTQPIQGSARIRFEADTSRIQSQVLAAVRQAVAAAEQAISSTTALDGLLQVDNQPLLDAIDEAIAEAEQLQQTSAEVVLDADPTPLVEAVAEATAVVEQLDQAADEVVLDADPQPLVAATERAGAAVDQLDGQLGGLRAGFDAALAVGTGAVAALGAAALASGGAFNILSQSVTQGLTAVLQSRDAAQDLISEVIELNQTAAFSRQSFLQATQQLVGYGVAAEQVTSTLDAMQQAAVATGGGEEAFLRLTGILSEVQSVGQATGDTVARLGDMGINLPQLIAEVTGQSVASVREAIAAGQIGLEEITHALSTRYAGAVAGYAQLWDGAVGNVMAGLRNIGSTLLEPLIRLDSGGYGVDVLNALARVLQAVNRQAGPLAEVIDRALAPGVERLTGGLDSLADRIDGVDLDRVIAAASEGAPVFAAMAAALSTMGSAALLSAIPGLGGLAGALSPLVAAIGAAVVATPELREQLVDLVDAVQPLVPPLMQAVTLLAGDLTAGLSATVTLVAPVVELIGVLVDSFTSLPDPIQHTTLALGAFAAALRFAGPLGAAVGVLTMLGAAISALGPTSAAASTHTSDLVEDLARLQQHGRITGEVMRLFGGEIGTFQEVLAGAAAEAERIEKSFRAPSWLLAGDLARDRGYLEAIEKLDEGLAQMVRSGEDADAVMTALVDTYQLTEGELSTLVELLPEYNREAERQAERNRDAASSAENLATATERVTEALQAHHDELRAQVDPLFAFNRALQGAAEAETALEEALARYGQGSHQAEQAALDLVEAVLELQGTAITASGVVDDQLVESLLETARASISSEEMLRAVEEAVRSLGGTANEIHGDYVANVEVTGVEEALRAAELVQQRLDAIDNFVDITFRYHGQAPVGGINVPMLADGGLIDHPLLAVVGESGPEAVLPLGRPSRLVEILDQPQVWGPVAEAMGKVVRRRPQPSPLDTLVAAGAWSPPGGASLAPLGSGGAGGGDMSTLAGEVRQLREAVAKLLQQPRAQVTIGPVHQAPGETVEQLARRIEQRMTPAWI